MSCYGNSNRSREEAAISSTIFVGNLSYETTEEELRSVLIEVDPGVRVRLGMDRATGKPRGFAFAEFADAARAADAIRRFDSYELKGRRLRVNDADDKPPARAPRPMSPPPGGGGGGGGGMMPQSASFEPPFDPGFRPFQKKGGSRRGLRGKKRSLR